jgi:hypothetical protein
MLDADARTRTAQAAAADAHNAARERKNVFRSVCRRFTVVLYDPEARDR